LLLETVAGANVNFGYDQSLSGYADKFTYLSPIVSGVQIGLSYAPDLGNADDVGAGVRTTSVADTFGSSYEAALRYEGMISNIGVNFGAGYSLLDLEGENVVALGDATSDRTAWNVGLDLDMGPFGLGVIYKEDNAGEIANVVPVATLPAVVGEDEETWVFGADYTTGPFKVGVSWYTQENSFGITNLDTDRYSGGVTYTYGPGMSFRGSVGYIEHDGVGIGGVENSLYGDTVDEMNSTYVSIGTQINF